MSDFGSLLVVMGVLWVILGIGVAYDAHKHGGNALRWFVITCLLGLIGLIWYSIAHTAASSADDRVTYRVEGVVKDTNEGRHKEVELSVKETSKKEAVTTFKIKCRDADYIPRGDPTVEVVPN